MVRPARTAAMLAAAALAIVAGAVAWSSWRAARARLAERGSAVARQGEAAADWPLAARGHALAAMVSDDPQSRWSAALAALHDPHPVASWHAHAASVTAVALTRDGDLLLSASRDGELASWSLDGTRRTSLPATGVRVDAVAPGPAGQAWTASPDGGIVRRDLATGAELERVTLAQARVVRLRAGTAGSAIAWTDVPSVLEVRPGEGAWRALPLEKPVDGLLAASATGRRRAVREARTFVRLEDAAVDVVHVRFEPDQGGVTAAALDADGRLLATGGEDGSIRTWQLSEWRRRRSLAWKRGQPRRPARSDADDDVRAIAFEGDGTVLHAATLDGRRRAWTDIDGEDTVVGDAFDDVVASLAWDAGGPGLVTAWARRGIVSVASPRGETRWAAGRGIAATCVDADAREIWTAEEDHSVAVRDLASGREKRRLTGHEGTITAIVRSRDRRTFTSSLDGTVREWDGGTVLLGLDSVRALAWSDDLGLLVAGVAGGSLHAIGAGRVVTTPAHGAAVSSVAFRPGTSQLASASEDGLALWEAAPDGRLTLLARDPEPAHGLAWSPDGSRLAIGGDAQVRVLEIPSEDAVAAASPRRAALDRGHEVGR